jgi:ArsR family transcriptional regulator, arsenate/arsenite/antimonite-responsive transcriptional repressor
VTYLHVSMAVYVQEIASNIDACQHRWVPNSLIELTPVQTVACCSPLLGEPLSVAQAERVAPLLKALAEPVRLRLLSLVASHAGGEACVCDLAEAFDLTQPTISHHLKVLHELGLLDRSKRGVWVYYKVRTQALADLGALIGGPASTSTDDR